MARKLTLQFLKAEAAAGTVLALAALAALIVANSPWAYDYFAWLKSVHALQLGPIRIEETLSNWIKEGLMSIFFLVVGLEIKHEILRGELSDPRKLSTPIVAALGGMIGPAAVYIALSGAIGAPHAGWPVPLATDIAFALAIFGFVGKGLPSSLRIFLLTLAIVDDLGAILLIGALYSDGVVWTPLFWALGLLALGAVVSARLRVPSPFWVLGFAVIWYLSFSAGLSTSLAAVAFAAIVPVAPRREDHQSPLQEAMQDLHPYSVFLVLPLFAFAKAGVSFAGLTASQVMSPLVVAIAVSLLVGKFVGVMSATWLVTRLGLGARPTDATWLQISGVSALCGVGFTMSLFLGALAFPGAADSPDQIAVKLGVIGGSVLSAILAAFLLRFSSRKPAAMRAPDAAQVDGAPIA